MVTKRDRETAVFVANLCGGVHGKIADVYPIRLEALGRHLDWSPDGEYLASVDKSQPEEPFHIVLIRARDGAKTAVTVPPGKSIGDVSPAFSPDGKSLAFLRAVSSGVSDVYVGPVAGGPARRLTFDNRNAQSIAWTPDGRWIVFSSDRRRNSVLWRVPAAGGDPERVVGVAENVTDPVFARDGRMAYTQLFSDANIWRVETAGKTPPVKVISSTQYDSSPQYSPDGSRVAFRSNRSGSNEIWVSDSSGRIPVQLTHYAGPLTGTPRWSPDGMNIAFDTRPDGQADIYVVSSIGGTPRRVTKSEFEDVVPSWSRDGAWIYFASNRTGTWQVWRVRADGSVEEQVTSDGGFAAFESPDGRYLYYAKGRGAPGLWRKLLPNGARGNGAAAIEGRLLGILGRRRARYLFRGPARQCGHRRNLLLRPGDQKNPPGVEDRQASGSHRLRLRRVSRPPVHSVYAGGPERQRSVHSGSPVDTNRRHFSPDDPARAARTGIHFDS